MRCLLALIALAWSLNVSAAPSEADLAAFKSRFDTYVGAGLPAEEVAAALQRWFGWPFVLRQYGRQIDIVIEIRAGNEITFMRTIGSIER